MTRLPLVEEVSPGVDSVEAFRRLCPLPHCLFLDSSLRHDSLGRYSFLAVDPFRWIELAADAPDPLATLAGQLAPYSAEAVEGLPPFQGGAAGLFGYELSRSLERLPAARHDEFQTPVLAVGMYDLVLAFDHQADTAWIISQGFPEQAADHRKRRAAQRIEQMRHWLSSQVPPHRSDGLATAPAIAADCLAPQFPVAGHDRLTSDFSRDDYLRAVARVIEYIRAGDVFQVNLSQRLLHPAVDDSVALYLRLRERTPATFSGYFDGGGFQLASASPERFLQVRDGHVEARPIKGTRPRRARPEADLFAGDELQASEKDRAENVMIVDLMRNDLSRVCRSESVRVPQLCGLEQYGYVQHLVSSVCGELEAGRTPLDLLRAAFPGGSITGAPKVRALQIIAELEPTARGPYCGSLGYLGFDGALDSSILIRTIAAAGRWWQLPVGGGVVAQSVPAREYEETWHKAEGMLRAV